jgi:peptide/nickel transport system substrate-binding protein
LFGCLTIPPALRSFKPSALALALLVACSRAGAPAPAPAVPTVRFAVAADPSTLDPLFMHPDAASTEATLARLAFEPFISLDPKGRPVPELLARIPTVANGDLSRDGRTIVYRLRPGVRWTDGVAVTAADVLFTLHAILDPRNPVRSHEGYDLIDRAQALDAHTVVLHLRKAWAPAVLTYFSFGASPQVVLPAHVLQSPHSLAQAPFGSAPTVSDGAYRFVSWTHGESIVYEANPAYWRGMPKTRRLDVRIVSDPSTNLLLLQSKAIDFNLIAPSQETIALRDPHIFTQATQTAVVAALVYNTRSAPLNDVRVRRAIAQSIDRGFISAKITLGVYAVTDMLQPQYSWAYDPSVREPGYDPKAADALFDAAGWRRGRDGMRVRGGRRLHLTYAQFPESLTGVRVADTIQAELRKRGVDVGITNISNAQLFLPVTGTLASGRFDLAYVPFTMGADPDDSSVLACRAPSNYMHWCDPQVDALETQALASTDQKERRVLYRRIAARVADRVPLLYLFNARYLYAYRDDLHGFAPNAFLPTWNAYAWNI